MAFSSQLLKAPSITSRPKLSKTSVSSSIFRGAKSPVGSSTTIKIPKGMGYGGKAGTVDPKYLQTKTTPIDQTLVETNNILIEIQRQLAFDYASRIEDEKNAIKSFKAAESKRKFAAKEKSVEGVRKIGGAIGGTVSKIAAPIKGIFDKIKEFFGLVLTGIVTNVAFEWLKDEKNRERLGNIFTFVGKAIPYLLAGLLGLKLIKWGTRLFRLGRFLFKLPGRILRVFGGRAASRGAGAAGDTATGRGGLFRNAAGQRRGLRMGTATQSRVVPGRYNSAGGAIRQNVDVITRQKSLFNKTIQGLEVTGKKFGRNFLKVLGAGPGKKTLVKSLLKFARPVLKRIPIVGALIDFALSVAMGENPGRAAFGAIGAMLLGTIGTFLGGPIGTFIGGLAGDFAGRQLYDLFFNKSSSKDVAKEQQESAVKTGKIDKSKVAFNRGGTVPGSAIYASNGMTVPGRGSRNVDSVSAMLAPGEEVIRTASARLFRPLLKDINDNAGRLWTAFSMGINKLLMVSKYQDDVNKEFSKVIEDQDRYQRNLKTERLSEATGGGMTGIRMPKIAPKAPNVTNVNLVPQSGGGMTFLPMVLPTQKSKPPQIPQMQSPATEAPNISSVNPGNPFMMLTPELYGIG